MKKKSWLERFAGFRRKDKIWGKFKWENERKTRLTRATTRSKHKPGQTAKKGDPEKLGDEWI